MFYSATYKDKYTKEQAFAIKSDLLDKLSGLVTVNPDSHRHDVTMVLPNAQTIYAVIILSDQPWVDFAAPVKVFAGDTQPHLLWFCETDGEAITKIDSIKTPLFKHLGQGQTKPTKRVESDNFQVTFVPADGSFVKISNNIFQWSGFSVDPVRSLLIEPDSLLDEKTGFGYFQFDPKLGTIDEGFWFMAHLLASLQSGVNSNYSALWPKYQEYLTR